MGLLFLESRSNTLAAHVKSFLERKRSFLETVGECVAGDELEHQEGNVAGPLQAVDGGDIGVIQRGEHAGFAFKAGEVVGVAEEDVVEQLDGDAAAEAGVGGGEDDAHSAGAEFTFDLVVAE